MSNFSMPESASEQQRVGLSLSGTLTAELSHPWLSDSTGICAMHVCAHVSVQNHYPQAKAFRLPFPAFVLQTRVVILR